MQKSLSFIRSCIIIFIGVLLTYLSSVQGVVFPFFVAFSCALIMAGYNKYVVGALTLVVQCVFSLNIWQVGSLVFALLFMCIIKVLQDKKCCFKQWAQIALFLISQIVYLYTYVFVLSEHVLAVLYICLSVTSFYIFKMFIVAIKAQPFLYRMKAGECFALCFTIMVMAGGISCVNIPYISVYHLVGVFSILVSSKITKASHCIVFSIMYGLGAVLACADLSYIALFVLLGLVASFLQGKTSIYSCLGVIITECVLGLYFNCLPFFTYMTTLQSVIACIMQFCITGKKAQMLKLMFIDDNNDYSIRDLANRNRMLAKAKLMDLSNVFFELDLVFKKMLKGDIPIEDAKSLLIEEVYNKICNRCKDRSKCSRFAGVKKEVETLMNLAFEKGRISLIDVTSNMANNCLKTSQIITLINKLVSQYKQYNTMIKNLDNSRLLIADQLCGVAKIMQNLSLDFDNKIDGSNNLENQIIEALEKSAVSCAEAVVYGTKGNVQSIALLVKSAEASNANIEQEISFVAGQKVSIVKCVPSDTTGWLSIILEPKPLYCVMCGLFKKKKNGMEVSGDCYSLLPLGNDKFLMAISDGMGHGEKAKRNSELTISVIENFYKAGFDNDIVLSSVNKLVCINQLDDFATLDLCVIDLKNAFIDMVKLGASQSYIKHEKNTTIIEGMALPLGVVEELKANVQKSAVEDGDLIILCSDGVSECFGGLDSLYMYINHLEEYSPQEVATSIGERAKLMCKGDVRDDVTILVVRVVKTN